ncbi:hypothetical protein QBC46DRAFT_401139 [Diplogelasinospora grovesii]|uniref:Uncharacterized protein n=1 Tax=Diplogelasinospora grovesii TaxID=303347 RepID=A0AAN6RYH5_9PEZI|nr:hypothetical protein QBC46DRAFT_401139 [Diplogelasinospora grovesii]
MDDSGARDPATPTGLPGTAPNPPYDNSQQTIPAPSMIAPNPSPSCCATPATQLAPYLQQVTPNNHRGFAPLQGGSDIPPMPTVQSSIMLGRQPQPGHVFDQAQTSLPPHTAPGTELGSFSNSLQASIQRIDASSIASLDRHRHPNTTPNSQGLSEHALPAEFTQGTSLNILSDRHYPSFPARSRILDLLRQVYLPTYDSEEFIRCIETVTAIKFVWQNRRCCSQPIFVPGTSHRFWIIVREEARMWSPAANGSEFDIPPSTLLKAFPSRCLSSAWSSKTGGITFLNKGIEIHWDWGLKITPPLFPQEKSFPSLLDYFLILTDHHLSLTDVLNFNAH